MEKLIRDTLTASATLLQQCAEELPGTAARIAEVAIEALRAGGTVAFCGNGGSAADCQHLAGELVGRFKRERPAYSSIALTTDTSILTAIGNDYGFDQVYSRQVEGLLRPGDVLIALSTSGNAENCVQAVRTARDKGVRTIGMTGRGGGKLAELCDLCLRVPHTETARIQEAHITIGHALCDLIERALAEEAAA
jgi:D-sedoheptulose 7-phosphate isomerase